MSYAFHVILVRVDLQRWKSQTYSLIALNYWNSFGFLNILILCYWTFPGAFSFWTNLHAPHCFSITPVSVFKFIPLAWLIPAHLSVLSSGYHIEVEQIFLHGIRTTPQILCIVVSITYWYIVLCIFLYIPYNGIGRDIICYVYYSIPCAQQQMLNTSLRMKWWGAWVA